MDMAHCCGSGLRKLQLPQFNLHSGTRISINSSLLIPTKLPGSAAAGAISSQKRLLLVASKVAASGAAETKIDAEDDDPINLGTAKLPIDVDLKKLQSLLLQWANSFCGGRSMPGELLKLQVDKIENGVRVAYVRFVDGALEELVHIDALVHPPAGDSKQPLFQAIRSGKLKNSVPPGEPALISSMLNALKRSVATARTQNLDSA